MEDLSSTHPLVPWSAVIRKGRKNVCLKMLMDLKLKGDFFLVLGETSISGVDLGFLATFHRLPKGLPHDHPRVKGMHFMRLMLLTVVGNESHHSRVPEGYRKPWGPPFGHQL